MNLIRRIYYKLKSRRDRKLYEHASSTCHVPNDLIISKPANLVMAEGAELEFGTVILNINAKFIMGKYSGAGPNLMVVTGNHMSLVGKYLMQVTDADKKMFDPEQMQDQDIVLEDDVWLGSNVVLLNGVRIGRGSIIAAGTVCRNKVPPYAIVVGNPAKVVGFRFTPEEIEEHESSLYPLEDRLPRKLLDKNYKKYYLDRLTEINQYCRI